MTVKTCLSPVQHLLVIVNVVLIPHLIVMSEQGIVPESSISSLSPQELGLHHACERETYLDAACDA